MSNIFFLGGSSASGFQTKFHEIIHTPGYYTYILKGGPGTGKSTLMKKIAQHFEKNDVELYYCSSDIGSLDAVVICDLGIIVVDGTAPHVFNADYPGVAQSLVDLGACWDRMELKENEDEIRRCFAENASYHLRARRFITALSYVNGSIYDQAERAADRDKILKTAERITADLPAAENKGRCTYKQLAAITSEGYLTQPVQQEIRMIGIVDDRYAAGCLLLQEIKKLLLQKGQDIVVSECVLFPENQIEHIMVPKYSLQFSLVNQLNKLHCRTDVDCAELYHLPVEEEEFSRSQQIALFLEEEAAYSIRKALTIHDELEKCYINALQFEELDRMTERIIEEIEERL